MLRCSICNYNGEKWGVAGAVFELESASLYYEFQCPECDSLDIEVLIPKNDEPSRPR